MRRAAILGLLLLAGASCDPGELNPDAFKNGNTNYPPSDWLSGEPAPCDTICNRIDACYPNRTDIRNNCRSQCPANAGSQATCAQCVTLHDCTTIEAGSCGSACTGMQDLTCVQSWTKASVTCDSMGCICRPPCTGTSNVSSECSSGCCINNTCVPMCACNAGYVAPTGC